MITPDPQTGAGSAAPDDDRRAAVLALVRAGLLGDRAAAELLTLRLTVKKLEGDLLYLRNYNAALFALPELATVVKQVEELCSVLDSLSGRRHPITAALDKAWEALGLP